VNEDVLKVLLDFHNEHGLPTTFECMMDTLCYEPEVWSGNEDEHRWWTSYDCVVKIGDSFIKYTTAKTTGDKNPRERGYEWSSDYDTIRLVVPKVELVEVTKYVDAV